MYVWGKVFLIILCSVISKCDKFPSLLTTNATLAIVIDREYLGDDYDHIKETIETYIVYAKRELLRHGGVNIQYYSWTGINTKRDLLAMISIASCHDTWNLYNTAEEEHLLHIAISEPDCVRLPQNQAITVPLIEKGEELPQIILDLRVISAYQWQSTIILFDHTLKRDEIMRVVSSLTDEHAGLKMSAAAISLINLNVTFNASNIKQVIKNQLSIIDIKEVGQNFLVIVEFAMVPEIMQIAKLLNLVNTDTQWLYVVSDTHPGKNDFSPLKRLLKEGDNVGFIYNTTTTAKNCKSGLGCHVEEILGAFFRSLDNAILDENEAASQVSDEEWESIRHTKLERRNWLLGSVKTYLYQQGSCSNCTIWKIQAGETWGKEYQKNASDSLGDLIEVGMWRPSDGPALVDQVFPHIKHGFRQKMLPIVSCHNPPWQVIRVNESGVVTEFGGLIFDVVKELARNLNFTFTVRLATEELGKMYGNSSKSASDQRDSYDMTEMLLTNSIPDSIIRMIQNKEAAIGACAFSVLDEYKSYVNYTSAITIQTYGFMAARPRELSRALLFMSPFTYDTWLCLGVTLILIGPILFFIHKYSPVYEYNGIPQVGGLSSVQNCLWYAYGALLQQGGMHLPYADSARLVVGTWWIVVLVVSTTYCGNLVAFLTFPKIDIPITTIAELMEHRDEVTWSTVKGSYFEKLIMTSMDNKYRNLYEGMFKDYMDRSTMLNSVEQGKHIYFDWKTKLHYFMKMQFLTTDRCDLTLGTEDYFNEHIAMIVAQDTPYLQLINREIKRLHQVGLIEKWYRNYLPTRDKCFKASRVTQVMNHTVNMDDMQGSFFVLVIGFAIAMVWLLGEKIIRRYYLQRNQKQQARPFVS